MCQLNLYLIPKSVEDGKVKKLFKKLLHVNAKLYTWQTMNDETAKGYADYNTYACVSHCDCGSIVSFLQNREIKDSWENVKAEGMKKELDRLNAIKCVMEQTDYKIKFDEVARKELDLLNDYNEKFDKEAMKLFNMKNQLVEEINNREDLTTEEKNNIINKELPIKINKLIREKEAIPELKEVNEKYQEFRKENEIILSSRLYSLERNQRTTKTEDGETIFCSSNCIYDVIEKTKNSYMNHYENEFKDIKKLLEELFKICDNIKILPFWQDNKDIVVNNEKNIAFNDFIIESVAYLKYNDILCIRR